MRCPYCTKEIHFEATKASAYPHGERSTATRGFDIAHGFCPSCSNLLVLVRDGKFHTGFADLDYLDPVKKEEVVYPKGASAREIPDEVPPEYREQFEEAETVLPMSPKASAALSRRLLQAVLREHFKIKPSTLAKEIAAFIETKGSPSYIVEALDAVRKIGNFAAHPLKNTNTGTVVDVDPGEAEWLLETIESLFDFAFVQPLRLTKRRQTLDKKMSSMKKSQGETHEEKSTPPPADQD